uniref:Uncharacterized protein n=1 Tax=Escherichia phage 121/2022-2B TaxID=3103121 RepID=A0AAU6NUH7_9VIRU
MVSFHLKISQNGLHTTRTVVLYNYQLRRSGK